MSWSDVLRCVSDLAGRFSFAEYVDSRADPAVPFHKFAGIPC